MNLQTIKSIDGKIEYVLLPVDTYHLLKKQIDQVVYLIDSAEEYISFELENYVQNPVALARIRANLTQEELAERLKVSQAYISKIESKDDAKISAKLLVKIMNAIKKKESIKLKNSNRKKDKQSGELH